MSFRPFARLAAFSVLLGGCATVPVAQAPAPPYVAPTSGPTARLLLRVNHPEGRHVLSTFEQPVSCSRRQEFASSTMTDPERIAVVLRANRLQTVSFLYVRPNRLACQVILSFEPKAGRTYLMRSRAEADVCRVELLDASNPDAPRREASQIQRERIGIGLNDNACKPLRSSLPPPTGAATPPAPSPGTPAPPAADSLDAYKDLLPQR